MRILVLGGTIFVGRHIVVDALARGHDVTLFSRGKHGPELFDELERLRGDRRSDLSALRGRAWDAAIDVSGYRPHVVAASSRLLAERVDQLLFVSTVSVYPDTSRGGLNENTELEPSWDRELDPGGAGYGPLKAACEVEVRRAFPDSHTILRPGLLVGPHDPTERYGYWPLRLRRRGTVLAPGRASAPVALTDARDHAAFALDLLERGVTGTFNVDPPRGAMTMESMLVETASGLGGDSACLEWVPSSFLVRAGVEPWHELPVWVPRTRSVAGFMLNDTRRAHAAGLRLRPLRETAADILEWELSRGLGDGRRGRQLAPQRERELLAAWRRHAAGSGSPELLGAGEADDATVLPRQEGVAGSSSPSDGA